MASLVLAALMISIARAQEPEPTPPTGEQRLERVPEVIVTATRVVDADEFERTPMDNTAARDILSPREVAQSGVISIQELMRHSPGVHLWDETGSDSLPNIAVRGVTANDGSSRSVNLAMFVDGIPLSSAPYGHPGASLFPVVVERVYAVDIQRGGASVRYGPNNVAGVVNFITRPIPSGSLYEFGLRYDSFDNGSIYTAAGGTLGELGVLFEGVHKDGNTFRENGDYTIENYALKAGYAFSRDVRGLFQIESFDDDSHLSDGLSWADYQADPDQSTAKLNRFKGDQVRGSTKLEWDLNSRTRAELIAYAYESDRAFYLGSPAGYGSTPTYIQATPRPMFVWALQPQLVHEDEWLGAHAESIVGLRYLEEDITRRVERDYPDGTHTLNSNAEFGYQAVSLFAETSLRYEEWTVTPGVRFEHVDIGAEDTLADVAVERDFDEALPALSASYFVDDDLTVYANVQSSFKAPEASQVEISSSPQDFSAQYAWLYEIGARREWLGDRVVTDLTVYQIDYHDRIEPDPDQFDVYLNVGKSRHRGVELALDADLSGVAFDGLGTWVTAAYNESEYLNYDYAGNDLAGTPPWLLSWGLRYEHEDSGLWAGLDGVYVDEAFSDRENTVPINASGTRGVRPAYSLWNARVGLRRKLSQGCELRATVLARNLFDEEYFEVRSGRGIYPGAPFSYGGEFGLSFSF